MAERKRLHVVGYQFLEDRRRNRLPASVQPPPAGFELRRLYTWCLTDERGSRLPVLLRPVDCEQEAFRIADDLCRRHGWRRA